MSVVKFVEEEEAGESVFDVSFRVVKHNISYTYKEACLSGEHVFHTRGRNKNRLQWKVKWDKSRIYIKLLTDVGSAVEQASVHLRFLGEEDNDVIEDEEYLMHPFIYNIETRLQNFTVRSPAKSLNITMKIAISHAKGTMKPKEAVQTSGGAIHSRYWLGLFESGKYSDITMIVGEKEFHVHSFVLSAVSPVFEAMIHSEMAEKHKKEIKVIDTTPDIMESVLRYMYTGEVKKLKENSLEIIKVAEKYELLDLKDLCQEELVNSIDNGNAIELYCTALIYPLAQLKVQSAKFIGKNKKTILANSEWEELKIQNPKAALQLLEDSSL